MLEWLAHRAALRRRQPAVHAAASAWPSRCARALKAPICCTLQGEDLFLDGLGEPYRQQSLDLIRGRQRARRRVPAGQPVLPRLHARLSRHPAREDAHRAARHQHSRATRRGRARATATVHDRLLRAHRAREGPARAAPRPTAGCATRPGVGAGAAGRRRATCAPEHQRYLDGDRARRCATGAWRTSSSIAASSIARGKIAFLQSWTCCRCRRPTTSRRGCSCSRRWRRRAGRAAAPRRVSRDRRADRRRPARRAGRSRGAGRRAARRSGAIRERAAALGRAGAAGVREHYDVGRDGRGGRSGLRAELAGRASSDAARC